MSWFTNFPVPIHEGRTKAILLLQIFHGKPMVVVPLFGDQQLNSKIAKKRRVGILIERHNLNRKTLTEAFQNTLTNR